MKHLLPFSLLLALFSCQSEVPKKIKSDPEFPLMAKGSIYNQDSISAFIERSNAAAQRESKKYFLQAIDMYRNKKDPKQSIALFEHSVELYPSAKAYYEFGNALMDVQDYENSELAYSCAQGMDYEPAANCQYNIACCLSLKKDTSAALYALQQALQMGYANKKQVLSDKDLENVRNTTQYKSIVVEFFTGTDDMKYALFKLFLKSFPELSLPYTISKEDAGKFDYKNGISYDFSSFISGMEDERFSRDVENEYLTVGKINAAPYSLVLYSSVTTIADTLQPVETKLAVYDSLGVLQDEISFSCYCSPLKVKSGYMDADHTVLVNEYDREWKNDPLENGYENNSITSEKLTATHRYKLSDSGKFVEVPDGTDISAKEH